MPKLIIVQQSKLSKSDKVRLRMKRRPRPEGMLQCNRCGGRSLLQIKAGVFIKDGRKTGGTMIAKDVCADCWKQDIFSEMIPQLKPTK